jgi:hypothetical protein
MNHENLSPPSPKAAPRFYLFGGQGKKPYPHRHPNTHQFEKIKIDTHPPLIHTQKPTMLKKRKIQALTQIVFGKTQLDRS